MAVSLPQHGHHLRTKPVDTRFSFFGETYQLPVFAGPVGAVNLHYGDKFNDMEYNNILVPACADAGIAAFTGDGTNPDVFTAAAAAIGAAGGRGIPTVKPWDRDTLYAKLDSAKASGAKVFAMDIDAAGLPFLKGLTPPAGSKTVQELREIIPGMSAPLLIKGIATLQGRKAHRPAPPASSSPTTAAASRTASPPPPRSCPPSPTR